MSLNVAKRMNNFRAQTALLQRETRGRGCEAAREKFCRSHLSWAPAEAGEAPKAPLATETRAASEEGRSWVDRLELWPSALASSEGTTGRRLFDGLGVQSFPAGEERGSDRPAPRWSQPARLSASARPSRRSGNRVLAPQTSHPSRALSVLPLSTRPQTMDGSSLLSAPR